MNSWRAWAKGLLAAFISGGSSAIANIAVDPNDFNFDAGLVKLCKVALVSALIGAGLYLKQSPVPNDQA